MEEFWHGREYRAIGRLYNRVSSSFLSEVSGFSFFLSLCFLIPLFSVFFFAHRLGGLVVKASASGAEDPGFESRLRRDFSGSSHISDLNIGIPVTTLPGAWRYRVSAGTGRSGVRVTGWGRKLDLQLLSQCGGTWNCLSRSVPEIHSHVAGTLSNQPTNNLLRPLLASLTINPCLRNEWM